MNKADKPNTITLTLKGDRITADKLRRSIDEFYAFVDEVVSDVAGSKKPISWIVKIRKGSIVIANEPEYRKDIPLIVSEKIFASIKQGVEALEKRAERPAFFSDKALEHLQALASIPSLSSNGLERISIAVNNKAHVLTPHVIANVDSLLGEFSRALGSIEGKLETISERGGPKLIVYDSLTNKGVRCSTNDEIMQKALQYFGKRGNVFGMISYDKFGTPKRIKVDTLTVLGGRETLPSILDLCGIMRG